MFETRSETSPDSHTEERAVHLARRRFARRQWARRWLAWRAVLVTTLVACAIAGSVWLLLASRLLAVSDVVVEGTVVLDGRDVRAAAAVPLGDPLATVDLEAITARVEDLAAVQDVDVSRSWPDNVRIVVQERIAVAAVERGGVYRGLDAEGVLFRGFDGRPRQLPLVRMSAKTRAEALVEAAEVVGALPADLARRIDFVEVRTVDTISLKMHDGRTILWGSADESADKAKVLAVLLKQKARTFDVSVPAQPTIRR